MGIFSPNIMANSFMSCAEHNPKGEVIVYGDKRITWEVLKTRIFKIADALIKLGVKKGDKVGLMFHNTPEFIEINWGIQAAGAIPVPMNYRFIPKEVVCQGNNSDTGILIYDSIWSDAIEAAVPEMPNINHFVCRGESGLDNAIEYEAFVSSGEDRDPGIATFPDDVAVIIYTGGTTGFPKGVMLTYKGYCDMFAALGASAMVRMLSMDIPPEKHKKMIEKLLIPGGKIIGPVTRTNLFKKFINRPAIHERLRERVYTKFTDPMAAKKRYKHASKSMFASLPFFHGASYASLISGGLTGNACFVLPESITFNPALVMKLIEQEKVANLANVPTGWKKLVTFPEAEKYDLSSIRVATTGGAACPATLKKQILKTFPNAMILDAFGQTEMSLTSFRIDVNPDKIQDRSVGKSIVDSRIVDDNDNDVGTGEIGEILYRSGTLMKGYYNDEETTQKTMVDGWFRSGDLGYLDKNGEIRVVDRKKECINTGGEKVFPLEVEEVLREHPALEDVCVIGVPSEEWGNTIRAVVQPKPGAHVDKEEIINFCRDKMAGYKIPRSVVFTDNPPKSPVGKMLRQKVRDTYGQAE